jgi:hypothetical protein
VNSAFLFFLCFALPEAKYFPLRLCVTLCFHVVRDFLGHSGRGPLVDASSSSKEIRSEFLQDEFLSGRGRDSFRVNASLWDTLVVASRCSSSNFPIWEIRSGNSFRVNSLGGGGVGFVQDDFCFLFAVSLCGLSNWTSRSSVD